jgi:hexosaminidase
MKSIFLSLFLFLSLTTIVSSQTTDINIIPRPNSVKRTSGEFTLDKKTKIVATDDAGRRMAEMLNDLLQRNYGFKLVTTNKPQKKNAIVFINALPTTGVIPNAERYLLTVEPNFIRISGATSGMFYGLQTLMQMLPVEYKNEARVPAAEISDQPRFPYRGMHLDVGRHFMPVSFVKKYIDLMAQYKFNYFHWHLTEDQGWRIEIKKYPRLTEIGSRRMESVKERNLTPYIGDGVPVEGFYTQEQIREVVAYAKARQITTIPEIELPGHSSAALAAYPELGCKENYEYKVQTTWGIFKEVYCPTEKTFRFLEDVLTETIALFPDSPYIHVGGDEVLKDHWKESAFVQELKKQENLKDEHEVQSYFIRRMEKYINSKGKKIIGWDEILEGGLAPNATVMSWRGTKGGIEAAKSKHNVIMTPTDFAYLDYGQGDPAYEPLNIGGYLPLEKVYSFEPVPKELTAEEAKYILGGQGNVWTEYLKTPEAVEYMAFPRMLALSEVVWSRAEDKNFDDFQRRLGAQFPRLDRQNVNYRIPEPAGLQNSVTTGSVVSYRELAHPIAGSRVYYTMDGSEPTERSKLYKDGIGLFIETGERIDLKTIVVLPSGRKSSVYGATFLRKSFLHPVDVADKKPGVKYDLLKVVPDGENTHELGETRTIALNQFAQKTDLKQPFGVSFDGYINVPVDEIYEFQVDSTWDTTILVGDERIIDDVGTKDRKVRSAVVPLEAGLHKISIRYNHRGGDAGFRFRWGIKGQGLRGLETRDMFH